MQYELLEDQRHQCTTAYSVIRKTFRTKFVTKEHISKVWLKACRKVLRLQIRSQSKSELAVIIASILFAQGVTPTRLTQRTKGHRRGARDNQCNAREGNREYYQGS
ncbi:hypothetical protein M427DRAFT_59220 [Gonapodya prolifera JEL478]|uniref:Uncharacterized protein n=1 Tax=Gonapodya prolifera (strain JEL478) TaxID=1344416 RepID=A0A139A7L2_GONPJ|nr:hypothetical protein M427DRAFT_59220 [Gonapodya prolifera JEL478]|eukprot:KXS12684.1 hypothetical protein M427DRAFT_59220 [Gonapodya prolifera JEL478]